MAVYSIDNTPVNQRADWRLRRPTASAAGRRTERFPGAPGRFVVKGPIQPRNLVISGTLTAATIADLQNELDTYESMQADDTTHSVTIHGQQYQNLDLAEFRQNGGIRPNNSDVRVGVQFTWQQLSR